MKKYKPMPWLYKFPFPLEKKVIIAVVLYIGRLPMRHLVYRVQALPQSLLSMVWDFGQLSKEVEVLYIRQIVKRYVSSYLNNDQ